MVSPRPRAELLRKLIECPESVETLFAELRSYPFDCDAPLFIITREHLIRVLDRFLAGELTPDKVRRWADDIEVRDDLDVEPAASEELRAVIYELAAPEMHAPLTRESATRMRTLLATPII